MNNGRIFKTTHKFEYQLQFPSLPRKTKILSERSVCGVISKAGQEEERTISVLLICESHISGKSAMACQRSNCLLRVKSNLTFDL